MKKLFLFLVLFCTILMSCSSKEPKPIERYQDKGYVLVEEPSKWDQKTFLVLKNSDTIIEVVVPSFDALNLKIGDTLKSKL